MENKIQNSLQPHFWFYYTPPNPFVYTTFYHSLYVLFLVLGESSNGECKHFAIICKCLGIYNDSRRYQIIWHSQHYSMTCLFCFRVMLISPLLVYIAHFL